MLRTAEIVLPKGKHTNYLSKAVLETCLNGNSIVQDEQVVFIYLGICMYALCMYAAMNKKEGMNLKGSRVYGKVWREGRKGEMYL